MRIVITGGGGFLGSRLAQALLATPSLTNRHGHPAPIDQILLFDTTFHQPATDPRLIQVVGNLANPADVRSLFDTDQETSVFHLASMVSGECEVRFDDALQTNLHGGLHLLDAARQHTIRLIQADPQSPANPVRFVFASSIACFGSDTIPDHFSDTSKHLPQTTYGVTKAAMEMFVNDYSRKGFLDGRSARLPTVIIRPGKPNAAASSWASGMFREPLAGVDCQLPVRRDQLHPMTSYRTVIESLIHLHQLPAELLGKDRAVGLPAHSISPQQAEAALQSVATQRNLQLGSIVDAYDPKIQAIVDGWATGITAPRAQQLDFPTPPPITQIIENYLDDYPQSNGI